MSNHQADLDANSRRALIIALINEAGDVSVKELSIRCSVSEMTIRRDLEWLDHRRLLRRVHGGAVSEVSRSYEPPFAVRSLQNAERKDVIARCVSGLLNEGDTVILDVGTTALSIAHALTDRRNLTVLTPSLRAAEVLSDCDGIRLMMTGGTSRPGELSLVGDLAVNAFAEMCFDTFVMCPAGIDVSVGLTEFNFEDARVKRTAAKGARKRIVAADSSKLGQIAFVVICPLSDIDVLVTDSEAPPEVLEQIAAADVEIVLAGDS